MIYYTNYHRDDGFGAQFQNIIWDILYSENNGYKFVYRGIKELNCHNYNNETDYLQKIEKYININKHYASINNISENDMVFSHIRKYLYNEIETAMDYYHNSDSFKKLQQIFFSDKKNPFDLDHIHVAVHIRRVNVYDKDDCRELTPLEYYLNVMNTVRRDYKDTGKPILFHIYSQGDREHFRILEASDVKFHLNEYLLDTFSGMVFADVLCTSTSSLSYTAALLTHGTVYYQAYRFWHPPLSKWRNMG
jgi:hypothetical protein